MKQPLKATLIGAIIGVLYGILYASQKYPAEWWTFSEGGVRVAAYVSTYAIISAVIGFGIGMARRKPK